MSQYVDQRKQAWIGRTLLDRSGQRIGRVEDLYADDVSGHPAWLAVATGRFGLHIIFLPFAGATPVGGDELRVQFPRTLVRDAPIAGKGGRLTQDEVVLLYDHYGFDLEAEEIRERYRDDRAGPGSRRFPDPDEISPLQAPAPAPSEAPARPEAPCAPPSEMPPPPARPRTSSPARPLGPLAARLASADGSGSHPESPLFWNHDDRIDSIRPPQEAAGPGRR